MPSSRIPSPARSQGVISTPRKDKLRRRTRSVCSPTQSNVSVRLSTLVSYSYKISPMPNRQSVLTDETDMEIVPGRQSWWKKLGDNSRDVMDVLETEDMAEIKNVADEFDVEVLSQEKQNYTLDLPESSDGESISSIVIPQRKLFTQKEHNPQKKFAQILNNRDSQSKHKSHIDQQIDKDIEVAPKNLFSQPSKPRNKPVFPAALLNISSDKTMNKTKEMPVAEVKGQVRSLFGNRPGTKRKNMFADFIVSDSEDDIPDIQPKVFGFQRNVEKKRRESSNSQALHHSPTSSIDLELDDWKLLPSSTMVGNQLEDTTPVKRARLSKLSEVKETMSTINKSLNTTKQSNKSNITKNKSKISSNSKLDVESSKLQDDNINVNGQSDDQAINNSNSRLTRNKSKSIRETSLIEANRSKTINKSKNIKSKDQSIVNKVNNNQENINLLQDEENIQNELLQDEGENDEDFTLEYENDDEQNNECLHNNANDRRQSKDKNDTMKQTSNTKALDKEKQSVHEDTNKTSYNEQESINKSRKNNVNMDIDMLDGNAAEKPVQLNNEQEIQNISNENLNESKNVKNKTNVSTHNTSKKHNKSKNKQDKIVEAENEVNQENHNNTRQNKNSQSESNHVSREMEHEDVNHDKSKPISEENEEENDNNEQFNTEENKEEIESNEKDNAKDNEENESNEQNNTEGNEEENVSNKQNNTEENEKIASDIEDQNESQEIQNESQEDETEQIDSEQEQNESDIQNETEEMEENQELNQSDENEEDDSDNVKQDDEGVTSNYEEEENESTVNKTDEQQDESVEIDENEEEDEENEQRDMENEDQDVENDEQDMENEDQDVENDEQEMENEEQEMENEDQDVENDEQEMENEEQEIENEDQDVENDEQEIENEDQDVESAEEEDIEQEIENDDQESNESEVEENVDENEQVDHDGPIEEENDNEDEEQTGNENDESPNITHDTTGRHRNIQKVTSPEAILHDKTNQIDSFVAEGRNTSVRKTKSILVKTLNIRPSLAPMRESTGFSDGTRNSSADNSGWDSHRTTRKTIRETFGKEFTNRKSLRALVMEKSAKRHTNFMEKQADLTENLDNTKTPQANSTELPHFDSYEDPEPAHVDETTEESDRDQHEMSKRTRQTTLEMYLQKIKQDNLERKRKIEEQVRNSLKTTTQTYNPFKVPRKPVHRVKPAERKPRTKQNRPLAFLDMLPTEVIEDMKYKPPKRFKPNNASWITKRLYKFLETKLEPKYDYKARVRAEKLVETIYNFTKDVTKHHVAPLQMVDALKHEMARLNIVKTHFDFYEFFQEYMPREIRIKVIPDVVNNISLPKRGVFADIIR